DLAAEITANVLLDRARPLSRHVLAVPIHSISATSPASQNTAPNRRLRQLPTENPQDLMLETHSAYRTVWLASSVAEARPTRSRTELMGSRPGFDPAFSRPAPTVRVAR